MNFENLMQRYLIQAPTLSYGGNEPVKLETRETAEYPYQSALEHLGDILWKGCIEASQNANKSIGYCEVNARLDEFGDNYPTVIPFPLQMEGQKIEIVIYMDSLGHIHMRAIGGYACLQH